jgi:amidohydrolase
MHPELGFQEYRTAGLVADALRAMGIQVRTDIGKTGVVGYLGEGRPAIGIRADMDALPLQEMNDVPYASKTSNVMHACGHDAHTAMLLGAAKVFSEMEERPAGEIRFLFQPCEEAADEEGKSGAMRMIEDGALGGLDAVVALHVASDIPAGKIEIENGYSLAAVDTFEATISGEGCHGAYPHLGEDPIFILAQVINAIHGIRARRVNPVRPAVISIGSVHGGDAPNVIPHEVRFTGTLRSYDDETRQQLLDQLEKAIAVSRAFDGDYELRIETGNAPMYNDPEVAEVIRQTAEAMLGSDALHPGEASMGAEDFGCMTDLVPGAMFSLGAQIGAENRPHHSPYFDLNESAFPIGVAMLVETTCRLMRQPVAAEWSLRAHDN